MRTLFKRYNPYILLVLFVIIGYWQVSFLAYTLKWDVIDVVLPFRYHFSECIQSSSFPFWNPWQQTGSPFFSDLQAPVYYPELLLVSLLGGYGVITIQILFVLYLSIAATGMYKLSHFFNKSPFASLIAGLAYSFSGYFVGHGQHFFLLVGAAWLPYVLLFYMKLNQERKGIDALKAGIFLFLMISGSYQALSIAVLYLVVLLFLYNSVSALAQKQRKRLIGLVKVNLLLFIIVLVLSSPLIVSTLEAVHSVGRLREGVSLADTLGYGQSLTSVISFFIPFSTIKYPEFFGGVDASMINHFMGIIPLVFFIAALTRKRSVSEYIILGFGLIIFAMCFRFLPIRKFFYMHIPFMNLFSYAAYLRIFGLLAFILVAANHLARFEINVPVERRKILGIASAFLGILLVLILASLVSRMNFHQHVLLQALFQFAIVSLFVTVLLRYTRLKAPKTLLILLFMAELFAAAQLNMSSTVVDTHFKPGRMQKDLSLYPDKFPIPINDKIIFNDQQHAFFMPFWRNTYIFTKQVSFDSFSSFKLESFSKLDDEFPNLKNAVLNNHLFYFSDKIFPLKHLSDSDISIENNSKDLYFSEQDFARLSDVTVARDPSDEMEILSFSPNEVVVRTSTQNDQFFTMLQTNYKGWKAYTDGSPTPVYTSNFNYRTIFLPEGNHIIRYEFKNNRVLILYILSNSIFFLCILFLLGYWLKMKNFSTRLVLFIPSALLVLLFLLLLKWFAFRDSGTGLQQAYDNRWSGKNAVWSLTKSFEPSMLASDSTIEFLPVAEVVNTNNELSNTTLVLRTKIFPNAYSKALIVSEIVSENQTGEWHAVKIEKQIEHLNQWNDIVYLRNFCKLKEKDIIKVYLWNPHQATFEIDSISLTFYDQ